MSQPKSLEERVQVMEDVEAIRSLHHTYVRCIDKGWGGHDLDAEGLRAVFADDIVWGPEDQAIKGADQVIEFIGGMMSNFDLVLHGLQNINIEVDGDTARGTQVQWVATGKAGQNDMMYASVSSGYVRSADGWRISNLDVQVIGMLLAAPQAP